jgi:hypothetical protein
MMLGLYQDHKFFASGCLSEPLALLLLLASLLQLFESLKSCQPGDSDWVDSIASTPCALLPNHILLTRCCPLLLLL